MVRHFLNCLGIMPRLKKPNRKLVDKKAKELSRRSGWSEKSCQTIWKDIFNILREDTIGKRFEEEK